MLVMNKPLLNIHCYFWVLLANADGRKSWRSCSTYHDRRDIAMFASEVILHFLPAVF